MLAVGSFLVRFFLLSCFLGGCVISNMFWKWYWVGFAILSTIVALLWHYYQTSKAIGQCLEVV